MLPSTSSSFQKYVDALDIAQRVNTRLDAQLRTTTDLELIRTAQQEFVAAIETSEHLAMSETNKNFHMAIARAGKNPYVASFYEKLLDEGRRMLHLHFDYIEQTREGRLLIDEYEEIIDAIMSQDVERADKLAAAHTRQLRVSFLDFLRKNYASDVKV